MFTSRLLSILFSITIKNALSNCSHIETIFHIHITQKLIKMAEQPLQGGNVFEITDYTTASDWERFVANIEEILSDWKLNKQSNKDHLYRELADGSISRGIWHEKREVLKYGNVTFELRYQYLDESNLELKRDSNAGLIESDAELASYPPSESPEFQDAENDIGSINSTSSDEETKDLRPKKEEKEHGEHELPEHLPECLRDLIGNSNDFASKAHCLVRWYNLRRFMILSPRGDTIVSEDRVKLVLSSASIALSNLDCHIPIFVQIHNPKNNFYQGISEHYNIRTMYEMVFYKRALKQYSYLSELISMFREKTGCNLSDPISATIRLNYCLSTFNLFIDATEEFAGNEHQDQDELVRMTQTSVKKTPILRKPVIQDMRSGATFERVVEALEDCVPHPYKILRFLHVAALWPPVSDKVITDSQVHSDLDPAEAPIWTIRCVTSDNCNMKLVHETQAIYELLCAAVNYAYDKMDASLVFDDYDRETLQSRCLKLSYDLSVQPEVLLSDRPSDSLRKLIALLFYRAAEITAEYDALDQIAGQLKKRPSLSEIYRTFTRKHRPSIKEFIIRTQISRPFNPISTPALPQRMFCTICDDEFRLCGAFSELCD